MSCGYVYFTVRMVTESKENHNETQWWDSEIGYKNILLSSLNNGEEMNLHWDKFILVAVQLTHWSYTLE